jgi:hypothetical protein
LLRHSLRFASRALFTSPEMGRLHSGRSDELPDAHHH